MGYGRNKSRLSIQIHFQDQDSHYQFSVFLYILLYLAHLESQGFLNTEFEFINIIIKLDILFECLYFDPFLIFS